MESSSSGVIIVTSSSKSKGTGFVNPFTLKVGQVFTGFGVGCGLGIGVGRPLNLGAIPMLNQVMVAARGASDVFSGVGSHVNRSLKMVGAKNIEAGIGCGIGFGHGFGVGLAIKPGVMHQIQTALLTTATKLMTKFGMTPSLSSAMLPQSLLQTGNNVNLATASTSRDGNISSLTPSRTEKVITNFLQTPLVPTEPKDEQAGHLHSEKDIIQLVLKQQLALEKLKEENDKLQRILVEDLKVSPHKFKVSGYTCSDCIECRRRQRRDRSGR